MMNKKELSEKRKMLQNARVELKKEFFGIDNIIDEVCRIIESWVLFPDMQERPLIINLWGMTGVGKTALIKRLAELIAKSNVLFRFDMGSNSSSWSIRETLSDVLEKENSKPMMLVLDEFQNAGNAKSDSENSESKVSRLVWDLLDSGQFNVSSFRYYNFEKLQRLIFASQAILNKGILVQKGKVVSGKSVFRQYMDISPVAYMNVSHGVARRKEEYNDYFIENSHLDNLLDFLWPHFKTEYEIRDYLNTLNGKQTVQFLQETFDKSITPRTFDCSKSVIFIIGNLDDAYAMSGDYNPDMNADDFHAESLKITRSDIKKVLSWTFRHEQIARLGNIHLIYPSLNSQAYRRIIAESLNKISHNYFQKHHLEFVFSKSILEMIYAEGVTPAQGVRPIQSTINQLIVSNIGQVINQMSKFRKKPDRAVFSVTDENVVVQFIQNNVHLGSMQYAVDLEISRLRKIRHDDNQAIVAVHESGHAVIDIVLLKMIPDRILSRTADASVNGFVDISTKPDFHSVTIIRNEIVSLFGGMAAEEIIFGHEHVTAGSGSDLTQATRRATAMIRNRGMGSFPGMVNLPQPMLNDGYLDLDGALNKEIKALLQESYAQALKIIRENQALVLALAALLNENAAISKPQIIQLLQSQFPHLEPFCVNNHADFSYRDHLLRKCATHSTQGTTLTAQMPGLVLNMEKLEK